MVLRGLVAVVLIAGCGPVELGDERALDAGRAAPVVVPPPEVVTVAPEVNVRVAIEPDGCDGCARLTARASGGAAPYKYEWDDGSHEDIRRVCPATLRGSLRVTARDALGHASVPHVTELSLPDASCPPPAPALCLENPSFEGVPALNLGFTQIFNCPDWSTCIEGGGGNTPDVVDKSLPIFANIPDPTDGETFLGLTEGEQVSQELCAGVAGGSVLALELDLQRLYLGANVIAENEIPFLEIWGGIVPSCMARELLWASPKLPSKWETFCVELRPQQFTNRLVLRAKSDGSQALPSYVLVDNLRPVSSCSHP